MKKLSKDQRAVLEWLRDHPNGWVRWSAFRRAAFYTGDQSKPYGLSGPPVHRPTQTLDSLAARCLIQNSGAGSDFWILSPAGHDAVAVKVALTGPEADELIAASAYWETDLEDRGESVKLKTLAAATHKLAQAMKGAT